MQFISEIKDLIKEVKMLKFNDNGKFRIMQISDTQDTQFTSKNTVEFIAAALDREKPDLVVFTGDQVKGYGTFLAVGNRDKNTEKTIRNLLKPLAERNTPFTFVFGNHDAQAFGSSKEKQYKVYKSYPSCLAQRGEKELAGLCNHNLEIKGSKSDKTVFNIYLIDSLSATPSGKCDHVTEGQLKWYQKTRDRLKQENGEYIKSLVFQHIPVPEIWHLLKQVPKSKLPHAAGYGAYLGKYYDIDADYLIKGDCDFLLETPGTPDENSGEFDVLREKGDVLGMFFGHDHNNSFVGEFMGLKMGYAQGVGFNVYGPYMKRGVRIIDLDENNLNTFSTHTLLYEDLFEFKDIHQKARYLFYSWSPPSPQVAVPIIKKAVPATLAATVGLSLYKILKKKH